MGTTLGGCFCDSCKKAANEAGIDFEKIKTAGVRKLCFRIADSIAHPTLEQSHEMALLLASNTSVTAVLMEAPELLQWLLFRRDSLTRFFKDIHDRIHAIRPISTFA